MNQAKLGQENPWGRWDDTTLKTQDPKLKPWRSETEHASSRSRRLSTILSFTSVWGRNMFVFFKPQRPENEPRTLAWKAAVLTTTWGPRPFLNMVTWKYLDYHQAKDVWPYIGMVVYCRLKTDVYQRGGFAENIIGGSVGDKWQTRWTALESKLQTTTKGWHHNNGQQC